MLGGIEMDDNERKKIDRVATIVHEIVFGEGQASNQLEEALEKIGVEVRYFTGKKYDGFLEWRAEKEQPVISINAETEIGRQRFSMAHELGHLIIDWNWLPNSDNRQFNESKVLNVTRYRSRSTSKTSQAEKAHEDMMDEFAAAFLITDAEMSDYILSEKPANLAEAITGIKERFTVSREAASRRLRHFSDLVLSQDSNE
jgi:Zn-dependent peptidase ImmA (M78 family)